MLGNSHFDYISQRASHVYTRRHYSLTTRPEELARKAYLLSYFEDYMAKTLTRDVEWTWRDEGRKRNMDFLVKYYRMKNAIVFKMSNEVLQVGVSLSLSFSRFSALADPPPSMMTVQLLRPHETPPHPLGHPPHLHRPILQTLDLLPGRPHRRGSQIGLLLLLLCGAG